MSRKDSAWYKASDGERIGQFKCIKHYETKELEINSKKGIIYPVNETTYSIIIIKTGAMKKFLPENRWAVKKGDELTFRFPKEELELWAKRLGIVNNRAAMIKRANEFGKPVVELTDSEVEDDQPDMEDPTSDVADVVPEEHEEKELVA